MGCCPPQPPERECQRCAPTPTWPSPQLSARLGKPRWVARWPCLQHVAALVSTALCVGVYGKAPTGMRAFCESPDHPIEFMFNLHRAMTGMFGWVSPRVKPRSMHALRRCLRR